MNDENIQDLYENNNDFKRYVDRYCRTYGLSVEDALEHNLVQEVGKQYQEKAEAEKN
jgi:hypothetical protein